MNIKDITIEQIWTKLASKHRNAQVECKLIHFSIGQLIELVGNGKCAYTGKEFESLNDITFERVNPKLGYVPGNVLMVNTKSNQQKSQLDSFMHRDYIPVSMKIKLLRKALYQLEKENGKKTQAS